MTVVLHGYRYSVYNRVVRTVLAEKSIVYDQVEVNPFAEEILPKHLDIHPFGRVPTLLHNDFVIYETSAITRYIDDTFKGPQLQPTDAKNRARMTQIISIIDSYAYQPLVRQVFSHRVFRPSQGQAADENEIKAGLKSAAVVLTVLEAFAGEGLQLTGDSVSLADIHLAPMIAYFVAAPEGKILLSKHPRLSQWWQHLSQRQSLKETDPGLP